MLTMMIERILILMTNQIFARRSAGTWQLHANPIGALLVRLLRRPSQAPAAVAAPVDPPVTVGTIIPSAREALRQKGVEPVLVRLNTDTRSKHLYCVGKSGMGKTNFNVQLIDADIDAGRAAVLLDYRGDLVDRVCQRIAAKYTPEDMADRLLILDLRSPLENSEPDASKSSTLEPSTLEPGAGAYTVGFNPLSQCGRTAYARGLFTYDLFQQHFGAALGVQTSETLQNCLLALALTGGNLLEIEPLLSSDAFRAQMLSRIQDTSILRFFARLEALPDAQRALWVNPIQNKLAPFTVNPVLRVILGGSQSVSIQDFLDRRPDGIVLFCAGADEHYGSTAVLMGNLFVHAVAAAVMRTDRHSGRSVLLYADEFQNLCGDKFSEIISEGRRFGLWLTLSHQSPSQLEPKIRSLVRNVVSTSLFFGVGGVDAETLAGEIPSEEPKTVLRNLLINQKPGEAMLLRQGMAAVRIKTPHSPDPDVSEAIVEKLRQASLRQHGRPTVEVEAELRVREDLFLPPAIAPGRGQPASKKSTKNESAESGLSQAAVSKRTQASSPSFNSSAKEKMTAEPVKDAICMEDYEVRDYDA